MHFGETLPQEICVNLCVPLYTATRSIYFVGVDLLTHPVDVSETLRQFTRHLLVQILMAFTRFFETVVDELLCRVLIDVVLQPGQVKSIQAECD